MKTLHSAHVVGGKQKQALGTVAPVCNPSPRNGDLEFQGSLGYTVRSCREEKEKGKADESRARAGGGGVLGSREGRERH